MAARAQFHEKHEILLDLLQGVQEGAITTNGAAEPSPEQRVRYPAAAAAMPAPSPSLASNVARTARTCTETSQPAPLRQHEHAKMGPGSPDAPPHRLERVAIFVVA